MSSLPTTHTSWSRRKLVRTAGIAAVAASATLLALRARSQPRKLTFAWSQAGFCLTPVPVHWSAASSSRTGWMWNC